MNTKPSPTKPTEAAKADPTQEPRNVAVTILENRTSVRGAIVEAGKCDFPLTKSEADALVALGKATIIGIF